VKKLRLPSVCPQVAVPDWEIPSDEVIQKLNAKIRGIITDQHNVKHPGYLTRVMGMPIYHNENGERLIAIAFKPMEYMPWRDGQMD